MAIYSLNHKPIGRTTHRAGQGGAHLRYISRRTAEPTILTNGISSDWKQAKNWLDNQESGDRSNARVIDRLLLALPIELDETQRAELVQDYLREITGNDIPWFAAIHQTGEDSHNPHAHVILRDRSFINGLRVVQTSEKGSTQHFREKWTEKANKALSRAGISEAIDNRTLKAQGIDREPTKHRGWEKPKDEIQTWVKKLNLENGGRNWDEKSYIKNTKKGSVLTH